MYTSAIGCTQQFRFCGNPFRIDMYKGCDFGCKYCFANSSVAKGHGGNDLASIEKIEKVFKKALETDEPSKSLTVEMLRKRVPLHCGGMSDPFQKREFEYHLTYKLIELSNKYNYPITFSTKQCDLPDEYFEILNPEIHAFQVSIMGYSDEFIKKYETNTPTAKERIEFVKKLRSKGFWCSVRIQPCVNIEEATKLVEALGSTPSYITIEHLKIPNDNQVVKMLFKDEYNKTRFYKSPMNFRNIEVVPEQKIKNIETIKAIANKNGVKIGVGDNDLHHLSQSRCCCGIDTINSNFENYMKYNLTYFVTSDKDDDEDIDKLWTPCSNCKECFYSTVQDKGEFFDCRNMTNEYVRKYQNLLYAADKENIIKKIVGVAKKRLF